MNPAHIQASNANLPVAHVQPTVDVKPDVPEDLYGEVKAKGPQVLLTDKCLMTYTTGNVEVVPERLLPVHPRFGLSDVQGLKRLGIDPANVANATMLPKGGVEGSAIVFGAPGANTTKEPLSVERLARLAAAITDNDVAHVVYVKHNSTAPTLELPLGQTVKMNAQGGPLSLSLIPTTSSSGAPEAFYFQSTLPSGQTEQSADIGVWELKLSDATATELHQTLKDLHEAAGGQTVAFGCQSGTSRSGAVAQLYYQRQMAEKLFKEGRCPSAQELVHAAQTWGETCKDVRANQFGERMPAGMLSAHASLLADEIRQRPMEAPRVPAPLVQPKPMQALKPLHVAHKPPATPPKPHMAAAEAQAAKGGPQVAPKPGPQTAPKPLHASTASDETPPAKPPRSKGSDSSDTESVFSSVSANSDSTFGAASGARPTPAPRKPSPAVPPKPTGPATPAIEKDYAGLHAKNKLAASPSHPYGVGMELKPLAPSSLPPPSDIYTVASSLPASDSDATSESVYSDIDDTYAQIREPVPMAAAARAGESPAAEHFRLRARESVRRMRDTGMTAFDRAGDIHVEPQMSASTSTRLHDWQRGQHERYGDLVKFLDGAGKIFAADARQGFRPLASKDSYGLGLTLKTLKEQAYSPVWGGLAQALEQTLDEASPSQVGLTDDILTAVLKDRLMGQFGQMDSRQKETWLRRTDKKQFKTAIQTLTEELTHLSAQVDRDHQDQAGLSSQLRSANLRLLTLKALYRVGTDPTVRR